MTYCRNYSTLSGPDRDSIYGHAFRQDEIIVQEKLQPNEIDDIYIPDYSLDGETVFQNIYPIGSIMTLRTPLENLDGAIIIDNNVPQIKYQYKGCIFQFLTFQNPDSDDLQYDSFIGGGFPAFNQLSQSYYEADGPPGDHQIGFTLDIDTQGHALTTAEMPTHAHDVLTNYYTGGSTTVRCFNTTDHANASPDNSNVGSTMRTGGMSGSSLPHSHHINHEIIETNNPKHINLYFYERIE